MPLIIKTTGFEDYLSGGAYIKCLVMGPPGAGKTRSSSFWPDPIFADCEDGRMSIADRALPYADINEEQDMLDLLEMLKRECAKGANRRYQTLVIDTIDNYQRRLTHKRLEDTNKFALSGWEDWGWLDSKMAMVIEKVHNLPMHVVVNMHIKETQEEISEGVKIGVVGPKLKGDIKDQIAGEFDLVGYMGTHWGAVDGNRALVRTIKWSPEPKYPMLKDRSGRLPESTVVDFSENDYLRLYNAIIGDHLDDMASATVVEEITATPATAPVAPNVQGGAVAEATDFPKAKARVPDPEPEPVPAADVPVVTDEKSDASPAPKKRAAKKTSKKTEGSTTTDVDKPDPVAPVSTPSEPEPEPEPEPSHDEAVESVQNGLGAEVVSDEQPADDTPAEEPAPEEPDGPPTTVEEAHCGDQPPHFVGVKDPVKGCGKALAEEAGNPLTRAKLDLSLVKLGTWLCVDDYMAWKERN